MEFFKKREFLDYHLLYSSATNLDNLTDEEKIKALDLHNLFDPFVRIFTDEWSKMETVYSMIQNPKEGDDFAALNIQLEQYKRDAGFNDTYDFTDRDMVFNYLYHRTLIIISIYKVDRLLRIPKIKDDMDIPEALLEYYNYDIETRKQILHYYNKINKTNNQSIMVGYQEIKEGFKKYTTIENENGTCYETHIIDDIKLYDKYSIDVMETSIIEACKFHKDIVEKQSEDDTRIMDELFKEAHQFYKEVKNNKHIKKEDIKEVLLKNISDYVKDNDLMQFYARYITIIMWISTNDIYDSKKFKKIVEYRLNNLSMSNFEVERKYLTSLLKKDSNYDRKKAYIKSLVDYNQSMFKYHEDELQKIKEESPKKISDEELRSKLRDRINEVLMQ